MPTDRTSFLDVEFDQVSMEELVAVLEKLGQDSPFGYLVTPNVDHVVRLNRAEERAADLAGAYRNATFCTCDSKILALLARWRGVCLPVVPGSDLTEALFSNVVKAGDRIALVGGDEQLKRSLEVRFPQVEFVQHIPPMGLMSNPSARGQAAKFIACTKARFTFVCVGSPQQELIAAEASRIEGAQGLALCVGAALDFITGRQKRAPALARRLGLEWAHRLLTNPRRLWRRYLVEGPAVFLLAYRWQRTPA